MPRKNQSEEKRAQILDAFMQCLNSDSPENVSVRQIAAKANVPLGSIHYYFENKTALVTAYYERELEGYLQIIRNWAAQIPNTISSFPEFYFAFSQFVFAYFSYENTHSPVSYSRYYQQLSSTPAVQAVVKKYYKLSAQAIADAITRTRFSCDDPLKLAYILFAQLDGYSIFCETAVDGISRLEMFSYLSELISK